MVRGVNREILHPFPTSPQRWFEVMVLQFSSVVSLVFCIYFHGSCPCFCPKALSFVFCLLSFVWHLSLDSRAGTCCAREFSCVLVVCSWSTRGVAFLCWNTVTTVWCSVGFRSGFRGLVEAV